MWQSCYCNTSMLAVTILGIASWHRRSYWGSISLVPYRNTNHGVVAEKDSQTLAHLDTKNTPPDYSKASNNHTDFNRCLRQPDYPQIAVTAWAFFTVRSISTFVFIIQTNGNVDFLSKVRLLEAEQCLA